MGSGTSEPDVSYLEVQGRFDVVPIRSLAINQIQCYLRLLQAFEAPPKRSTRPPRLGLHFLATTILTLVSLAQEDIITCHVH